MSVIQEFGPAPVLRWRWRERRVYSLPQRVLIRDKRRVKRAMEVVALNNSRDRFMTSSELRCGVKENHREITRRAAP
jgi:hypothetical protein